MGFRCFFLKCEPGRPRSSHYYHISTYHQVLATSVVQAYGNGSDVSWAVVQVRVGRMVLSQAGMLEGAMRGCSFTCHTFFNVRLQGPVLAGPSNIAPSASRRAAMEGESAEGPLDSQIMLGNTMKAKEVENLAIESLGATLWRADRGLLGFWSRQSSGAKAASASSPTVVLAVAGNAPRSNSPAGALISQKYPAL